MSGVGKLQVSKIYLVFIRTVRASFVFSFMAAPVENNDGDDDQKVEASAAQKVKAKAAPVAPVVSFFGGKQCKVIKLPSAADKDKVTVHFQYCGGECGYEQKYEAARVCTSTFHDQSLYMFGHPSVFTYFIIRRS